MDHVFKYQLPPKATKTKAPSYAPNMRKNAKIKSLKPGPLKNGIPDLPIKMKNKGIKTDG